MKIYKCVVGLGRNTICVEQRESIRRKDGKKVERVREKGTSFMILFAVCQAPDRSIMPSALIFAPALEVGAGSRAGILALPLPGSLTVGT